MANILQKMADYENTDEGRKPRSRNTSPKPKGKKAAPKKKWSKTIYISTSPGGVTKPVEGNLYYTNEEDIPLAVTIPPEDSESDELLIRTSKSQVTTKSNKPNYPDFASQQIKPLSHKPSEIIKVNKPTIPNFDLKLLHTQSQPTIIPNDPIATDNQNHHQLEINQVKSSHILNAELTPFYNEENLDRFAANTYPLYKFQILRTIISKITRAEFHLKYLLDTKKEGLIPRGLKVAKPIQVIDPDTEFQLKKLQLYGDFESDLRNSIITHYQNLIPKLTTEFEKLWTDHSGLTTNERELLCIKLVHYKNEILNEKQSNIRQKQTRDYKDKLTENAKNAENSNTNPNPNPNPNPNQNPEQTYPNPGPSNLRPKPQRQPRNNRYQKNY